MSDNNKPKRKRDTLLEHSLNEAGRLRTRNGHLKAELRKARRIIVNAAIQLRLVIIDKEWWPIEVRYKDSYKDAYRFLSADEKRQHDNAIRAHRNAKS